MPVIIRRRKLGLTSCREIAALSTTGIVAHRNDKPFPEGHDLVFRWGCTSNIPIKNVVNTAEAIHRVSDKAGFRMLLDEHDLCPNTYFSFPDDIPMHINEKENTEDLTNGPVIVRPKVHSRGRHVYKCDIPEDIPEAIEKCGPGWYASDYIEKVSEYRVFVVQGRAVCVAEKTPGNPDDVAWNVAKGGRFDNVRWDNWPLQAVRKSIEAFNLSGLDFGGVDVMIDAEGEAYIIEINSAPSLTSPYRQQCMAKAFDWIVEHGKGTIPLVQDRGGYLKFIHPAITNKAKLRG